MKFRKKPVIIEAIQWNGTNKKEIDMFVGTELFGGQELIIETLEGMHHAKVSDWIIKGVMGEFYPIKNDIFLLTYEKVDEIPITENAVIPFTSSQLLEIEKMFDWATGQGVFNFSKVLTNFCSSPKLEENAELQDFISAIIREQVKAYDTYRTISAKCQSMRENIEGGRDKDGNNISKINV